MSNECDLTYFAARALVERDLAGEAASAKVAVIHISMAERYEALASGKVELFPTRSG